MLEHARLFVKHDPATNQEFPHQSTWGDVAGVQLSPVFRGFTVASSLSVPERLLPAG